MRIAIIGSRDYQNQVGRNYLLRYIQHVAKRESEAVIVSGGAVGIDQLAESFARAYKLRTEIMRPEMEMANTPGLSYVAALIVRDKRIVDTSDRVLALWTERSRGTGHGLKRAIETGKPLWVIGADGKPMERAALEAAVSRVMDDSPAKVAAPVCVSPAVNQGGFEL